MGKQHVVQTKCVLRLVRIVGTNDTNPSLVLSFDIGVKEIHNLKTRPLNSFGETYHFFSGLRAKW